MKAEYKITLTKEGWFKPHAVGFFGWLTPFLTSSEQCEQCFETLKECKDFIKTIHSEPIIDIGS